MTSTHITPASAAAQRGEWTDAMWAAYWVGHDEGTAHVYGRTDSILRVTRTEAELMTSLGEPGRATAANRAYREGLYGAYSAGREFARRMTS